MAKKLSESDLILMEHHEAYWRMVDNISVNITPSYKLPDLTQFHITNHIKTIAKGS